MEAPIYNNLANKEKEFNIISTKSHSFKITFIDHKSYLIIKGCHNNSMNIIDYEEKYSFEKLKEFKIFNYYETIEEILEELFPLINNQKVKLIEEKKKIALIIELPFNKIKEITFSLKEKEKDDKEKISDLYTIINNQKNEINDLKKDNAELKNQMQKIILKVTELEKKLDKIENDKKIKEESIKIDSNIIGNPNIDMKFLNERLLLGKNYNKNIKYNLIYRATRDGDGTAKFHQRCKGNTSQLIVIKTTDSNIFGGYTQIGFQSRNDDKYKDDEAFVFSFDQKKIYNIKKGKEAIYDSISQGPFFGNYIDGYCIFTCGSNENLLKCQCHCELNSPYEGFTSNYELNKGKQYFYIQELEVFGILFS